MNRTLIATMAVAAALGLSACGTSPENPPEAQPSETVYTVQPEEQITPFLDQYIEDLLSPTVPLAPPEPTTWVELMLPPQVVQ
jgi:hypothetical protein